MESVQFVLASSASSSRYVAAVIVEEGSRDPIIPSWFSSVLLTFPIGVAAFSAFILLGQLGYSLISSQKTLHERNPQQSPEQSESRFHQQVTELGGPTIFSFKVIRLLSCLVLAGLSLKTSTVFGEGNKILELSGLDVFRDGLCVVFAYASIVSFLSVSGDSKWSRIASAHVAFVLFVPWLVYVYRDIWPLATFTLAPPDAQEGCFLWLKISILSIAVLVPLLTPRQHVPEDPEDVTDDVAPTDVASPLSMMIHSYCDPIIYKANKVEHLKFEELPPLSDTIWAKNIVKRSYKHLDPLLLKKKRHIGIGLIFRVFGRAHLEMASMLVLRTITSFLAPLGINRLLNYLETGGQDAVVRPWVWIVWLFLGPTLSTVVFNWFVYRALEVYNQTQVIVTQLIFDHAMRMRVKSDVPDANKPTGESAPSSTAVSTPDTASVAEQSTNGQTEVEEGDTNSVAPSVATSATQVQSGKKSGGGKGSKGDQPTPPSKEEKYGSSGASKDLVGRLNNLITTDLASLQGGQSFMLLVFYVPTQIILSILILHTMLGWSVYLGLACMIALSPFPGYIAKLLRGMQVDKMKKSDSRVQTVTETMNVIRMVKLFGWEQKMSEQLAEKRTVELKAVRKLKLTQTFSWVFNNIIPVVTMVVTYGTYTLVMKQTLTASKVFSSMAIFEIIQDHFSGYFYFIPPIIQAKVSLDRINNFLYDTELLDEFSPSPNTDIIPQPEVDPNAIGIRSGSFTWTADLIDGSETPRRKFTLRIEDELFFKRGCVNLIIGQTGSGKTSLLMALLGEMHYTPTGPDSVVNLPREGGVAYHAQESWVLNDTIRNNIVFGSPFDEGRYQTVVEQCGLKPDLALFSAGDETEVGEKGITLSGGQKARVTLARAVYSPAEILLLDDVLAALDVHTAKWIVDKCFRGDLLRGRTIILVTHNIALTSPLAEFVVSLSSDGRIASQGSLSSALAKDKKLQAEINKERQAMKEAENEVDQTSRASGSAQEATKKPSGQLVIEEEIALGHIGWQALKLYLSNLPGSMGPFVFWIAFTIFILTSITLSQVKIWVLGRWAKEYETHVPSDASIIYFLSLYSLTSLIAFGTYATSYAIWVLASMRASQRIHGLLMSSILKATLRWFDKTPISRVITRCTQDIASIDGPFAASFYNLVWTAVEIVMKFGAVILISPIFSIPGTAVILVGCWFGHIYMKAQLPVKRESSNAKAPVLGYFGSAVSGLVSIRAYGAQAAFRRESYARLDKYTRTQVTFWNLNRWVAIRSSGLAGLLSSSLGAYLIYGGGVDASTIGFSLTMAAGFSNMILWLVRLFNMTEVEGNSVERIQQYLGIEQEVEPSKGGEPPAYWPASGDLRVEGLSARYSPDGPKVLDNLSFHVKSGERVGIVGRTGSGKSSLTLALLRCIITEGKVFYDGISTDSLNLSSLRSRVTIIPQVPELLSGTLRQNLDPFSQHEDVELNDALRSAGLFSLQSEDDESRLTLDSPIAGGGNNLSVGQRQIIALARAIVRQCKLLILDEATSAIDYDTDNIIQTSLRSKLGKDVTLLTVAHRLQTIMDADKVMVLDQGQIVEFDKPSELVKNEKGFLRMLVDESGDKEKLYAMASGNTSR